jgi:hypothetical protein
MISGGNRWRLYVLIHRFYQFQAVNLAVPPQLFFNSDGHGKANYTRCVTTGRTRSRAAARALCLVALPGRRHILHTKRPREEFAGNIEVAVGSADLAYLSGDIYIPITDKLFANFSH